jgi:hypothetical protein
MMGQIIRGEVRTSNFWGGIATLHHVTQNISEKNLHPLWRNWHMAMFGACTLTLSNGLLL